MGRRLQGPTPSRIIPILSPDAALDKLQQILYKLYDICTYLITPQPSVSIDLQANQLASLFGK